MKQLWRITERYYPWLLLLLGVDCFCAIILWISDIQAFQTLSGLVVLTSLLLFSAILRRLRNAKHRINTVFFVVKIKYLLKVYGKIELTRN